MYGAGVCIEDIIHCVSCLQVFLCFCVCAMSLPEGIAFVFVFECQHLIAERCVEYSQCPEPAAADALLLLGEPAAPVCCTAVLDLHLTLVFSCPHAPNISVCSCGCRELVPDESGTFPGDEVPYKNAYHRN